MKKKYIRPESRLYAINLSENIASSEVEGTDDAVSGNSIIKFTQETPTGCRKLYTNIVPVTLPYDSSFSEFYNELLSAQNFLAYFECFRAVVF